MFRLLSLVLLLLSVNPAYSKTLMILGDSLSAGYQMPIEQAWPSLLTDDLAKSGQQVSVINASISGDTTGNGLARLPQLLQQHNPEYVLIELGANDGLRGFPTGIVQKNLSDMITMIRDSDATPLLMQIHILPNYGKRYTEAFASVYPKVSQNLDVPLLPFFLEGVIIKPEWMMSDGLHPKPEAQPWISNFVADELINHF
ncbi:multifunctional acyl-CoA thioesterase I/protease I/lysophospholipase L1 [Vibrio europaeus]|jgi:acyl-CoA thioesterase-1|uniref:Multifunctional acyl-CoA thioesterase I/protease I/lysophospholipase L1 n=4 Tax=Vibrio oreintalis group TaxID=1891919 RepID=A0AAE7AYA3_9VIBR|nr:MULTISPECIES: multifunctional acyl-CoA thioesterase I/protease I/lysophospholipase L1 [Vibrio oreintalis group]AIW16367.1 acyl-CoA thioesterase [Vibrio tubiashii ATCC 19109]EIF02226.1 arylesterase precursor [Vibrio tubiashii NCIMB 1337 = ATCC 19106]MCG9577703.1 multifunctional acyl-CoA thioesterase I/protease I/lysophospholipase L1 [Vibrio tubiashii]MCG9580800.1 multifunctional acyl-CoA thioesterase I/protease I/lysophospholipase L1 [Vibrio tubiashii]MCG9614391.1 multifunctional acyl-CoA th